MFCCPCIQNIKWYKWDGSYELRNVMEIVPKRNVYDAFQNLSIVVGTGQNLHVIQI